MDVHYTILMRPTITVDYLTARAHGFALCASHALMGGEDDDLCSRRTPNVVQLNQLRGIQGYTCPYGVMRWPLVIEGEHYGY